MKFPVPELKRINNCTAHFFGSCGVCDDHDKLAAKLDAAFNQFADLALYDQTFATIHAREMAMLVFPADKPRNSFPYEWGEEKYETGRVASNADVFAVVRRISQAHNLDWPVPNGY